MSYIGRDTDKISNVEVLDNITFDGSSSYTLQKNSVNFTPSSANTLLVSIDGVVQAGNFTVSGSTIDFGTAVAGTSTCDFILHYGTGLITTPADGTVTTAKLANSSVSLDKLSATGTKNATTFLRGDNTFAEAGGGIEMADQWRLTANLSTSGDITSNLERVDTTGFGYLGTGMTESSGIFSFPSTGIYLVRGFLSVTATPDINVNMTLRTSTDNFSSEEIATLIYASGDGSAGGLAMSSFDYLFDVTNTSTHKVKFTVGSVGSGSEARGNTDYNQTHFTFIRLGDT